MLTGSFIWTCAIAVYRILCIKAQTWVKEKIGEKSLLAIFVVFGLFLQFSLTFILFVFDDQVSIQKSFCDCRSYKLDDFQRKK
jgi:hypothetical protein